MTKTKKLKLDLQKFAQTTPMFELVTAPEIATYWTEKSLEQQPYLGEILFPDNKQLGMELSWFVGQSGAPQALQPSGLDAAAIPRDRKDFEKLVQDMFFFRESKYIDEKLRQELLKVMQTGNKDYIDIILNKIFADTAELISGAAVQREIMRMQLITTGEIDVSGNGRDYALKYGFNKKHMANARVDWSSKDADPIEDIENAMDIIEADTGERPTRAIFNSVTLRQLRNSEKIGLNLYPNGGGHIRVSKADVIKYLADELEIEAVVYSKLYTDKDGNQKKFIKDDVFVLLPGTELGNTWFGTTPEEADLMSAGNVAQVQIVDTGVAVTTETKVNPVTVDSIVSMMSLPSFEQIEKVFILKTASGVATAKDEQPKQKPKVDDYKTLLAENGIEFDEKATKADLIELAKTHNLEI